MYLCFVDESGTHGASPVLVVGGIVIHEEDAWHLQRRLDSFLFRRLHALGMITQSSSSTDPRSSAATSSGTRSIKPTATGSSAAPLARWRATPPSTLICLGVSSEPSWSAILPDGSFAPTNS